MMLSEQKDRHSPGTQLLNFCSAAFFTALLQFHFNKMRTLSMWIIGLLCSSLTAGHGLNSFPKNFETVKTDETATLRCDTNFNGDITWKFEGNSNGRGKTLTVPNVDVPDLGEYSCWDGNQMLASTVLLLKKDADKEDKLECRAKSYDCNFTCTLNSSKYRAARLGHGQDCVDGGMCQWISSESFQFEVSHSLSPYVEESSMLTVVAEVIDEEYSIIQIPKTFYLRDIVQPDSPQIVKCEEVGTGLNVTVEPPPNWSTPHSYFSLEYEIQYKLKDNGKIRTSSSSLIPDKNISELWVRCRESLVPSNWSHWSDPKNVATGKRLCKCKNKAKFCCPELPSGFLEACPQRKKKGKKGKKSAKANV